MGRELADYAKSADTLTTSGSPMSFRARLTTFFLLIVVVPMVAIGFLVFRLITDSEQGKAAARADGLASAAASLYQGTVAAGRADAVAIGRNLATVSAPALRARLAAAVARAGLARARIGSDGVTLVDVGDSTAIAPGTALITGGTGGTPLTVVASELTAQQYARDLESGGAGVIVRQGGQTLGSTLPGSEGHAMPRQGTVSLDGSRYRAVTQSFRGFGDAPVEVTVLSSLSATNGSVGTSRALAGAFIAAFLLLAFAFSVLASRALQGQLSRFLDAARRLAGGDFSAPVPTAGNDEFAALGTEFNHMSEQLSRRLDELSQERARLHESIRRIGQSFASNLDRPALMELALKTAVDAVQASCGRISAREKPDEPLSEAAREGSLAGLRTPILEAERAALNNGGVGESSADGVRVAAIALAPIEPEGRAHGLVTVARPGHPFSDEDRDVLRSLAGQAALALENVELHFQVRRQAVTDELTGLANHGRFQELLGSEMEQVRRYEYPVGLIMLDLDDFKAINDSYGHLQGDVVLRHVAQVLRQNSRDADSPARYGGEEMALILPHTDLEGAYAIAERVRSAIAALRVPRTDGEGALRITASLGVTASSEGDKEGLIHDADTALYEAKRRGKNRTARAPAPAPNLTN